MKYIDADKLIAEIKRQKHELELSIQSQGDYGQSCHIVAYDNILSLIDSLQQEQPDYKEAVQLVFEEELTPFKDGDQWCFLLGHNLQDGICGFGDTILDAAVDFYKDYINTKIHIGELKISMAQQKQPEMDFEKEEFVGVAESPLKTFLKVNDLDEAAKKEIERFCSDMLNVDIIWARMSLTKRFGLQMAKFGAEWMARQGETKEGEVIDDNDFIRFPDGAYIDLNPSLKLEPAFKFKDGDKVIVQIRKI